MTPYGVISVRVKPVPFYLDFLSKSSQFFLLTMMMPNFTTAVAAVAALFNTLLCSTVIQQILLMVPVVVLFAFVYYLVCFDHSHPPPRKVPDMLLPEFCYEDEDYMVVDNTFDAHAYASRTQRELRVWAWYDGSVFPYPSSLFHRRYVPTKTDTFRGYCYQAKKLENVQLPFDVDTDRVRSVSFDPEATQYTFILDSPAPSEIRKREYENLCQRYVNKYFKLSHPKSILRSRVKSNRLSRASVFVFALTLVYVFATS